MKYLLDTDICIYIMKRKPADVLRQFEVLSPGDVGISSVTLCELQYGLEKSLDPQRNQAALDKFLVALDVVPFGPGASVHYGKLRIALQRAGKPIGALDMLIAAHAMDLAVPLVTNNTKEFIRIRGLKLENWTAGN